MMMNEILLKKSSLNLIYFLLLNINHFRTFIQYYSINILPTMANLFNIFLNNSFFFNSVSPNTL
jgi:hypothetical protein